MQAFSQDLTILRGATFEETFTWSEGRKRTPVDLTGCTARAHIRASADAEEVLVTLTTENGGLTLGGVAGTITLFIADSETSEIEWTDGVYDLEIVQTPISRVKRLMQGTVSVSPNVTR